MSEQQITREFRDGFTIKVSLKRGTGTRDEDKLAYTVHGETQEKAEERADRAMDELARLAQRARGIQTVSDE